MENWQRADPHPPGGDRDTENGTAKVRGQRRPSLALRSHGSVGDARLNKVLGCFGPRVETDLPEHFAVLLGVHVLVPKGAISIKKVGCSTDAASLSSSAAASRFRLSSGYSAALERRQSAVCSKSSLSASLISSSVILCLPPSRLD